MAAGFGTTVKFSAEAEDKVSAPLEKATGATQGLFQSAGLAGGSLSSLGSLGAVLPGMLGPAAASAGALSAALGPIAIAVGVAMAAVQGFNMVVGESNRVLMESVNTFAVFEKKLAEVQTILGVTREAMAEVTDVALSMGAAYGKSAAEELAGFYQTASAGFANASQAATIMDTSNKLATAGITDMSSSVDLLTTVLNGFQMQAQDSMEVSDALFTTVRAGKTTVGELAASFGNVVPSAAAAGAQLDETLAALASLTLAGQSTAEASTALARSFDFLVKKPEQAMREFEKFGLEADQLDVRGRGLQLVIADIAKAFEGNEEALAQAIPQIRAFKAIMPLAGSQAESFNRILGEMEGKIGATDQAFDVIANTLSFQRDRWESMMEGIKTRLGQVFAPAIRTALDILNDLLGVIEKLPAPIKNTIFGIAGIGLALPSVVGKIGSLLWTLAKLSVVVLVVGNIFVMLQTLILGLAPAMGAIIGRVIKFAVAWRKNLDNIQEKIKQWATNVKLIIRGLGEAIANEGMISGPLHKELEEAGVTEWVAKLFVVFDRLKTTMEAFWEAFSTAVINGAESLGEAFPELQALSDMFKGLGEDSEAFAETLDPDAFKEFGATAGKAMGEIIRFLAEAGRNWEENKETIEAVVDFLKLMGEVIKAILPIAQALWKVIGPILKFGVEALPFLFGAVPETTQVKPGMPGEEGAPELSAAEKTGQVGHTVGTGLLQAAISAVSPAAGLLLSGNQMRKQVIQLNTTIEVDKEKLASKVQEVEMETGEESFAPTG